MGQRTVYRYLAAAKAVLSTEKRVGGSGARSIPKNFKHTAKTSRSPLHELAATLAVSHNAIWVRLGKLGFALKKARKITRTSKTQRRRNSDLLTSVAPIGKDAYKVDLSLRTRLIMIDETKTPGP